MSLEDISADLKAAAHAQRAASDALIEFQAACVNRDWAAAERARLKVETSTQAFLDHYAAAHKRMG